MTTSRDRRQIVTAAAEPQGGVMSRDAAGSRRRPQRRLQGGGRRPMAVHGQQTVAVHTLPLGDVALRWRAIWEVGPAAALDGVNALAAAGTRGFDEKVVHVSVPRAVHHAPVPGVGIHRVQRVVHERVGTGVPRTRPAVAAIRAASWAVSDRQAALLLALPVQQRVVAGSHLRTTVALVGVRRRERLISQLVRDIADGAQSLGELDFARLCRRRGLPPPDRQVVRRTSSGRVYLDVRWSEVGLVVEIDGSGHRVGLALTDDNLRQNRVTLLGDVVLRIDLVGLRVQADAFLDQICEAHAFQSSQASGSSPTDGVKRAGTRALSTISGPQPSRVAG